MQTNKKALFLVALLSSAVFVPTVDAALSWQSCKESCVAAKDYVFNKETWKGGFENLKHPVEFVKRGNKEKAVAAAVVATVAFAAHKVYKRFKK